LINVKTERYAAHGLGKTQRSQSRIFALAPCSAELQSARSEDDDTDMSIRHDLDIENLSRSPDRNRMPNVEDEPRAQVAQVVSKHAALTSVLIDFRAPD